MKAILTYNGNPTKPKVVARGIYALVWPYPDHETSAYYAEKLRGRYTGFLVEIETKEALYPYAGADYVSKIGKVTELAGIECIPFDLDKATQFAWKAFIHLECKKLSKRTEKPVFTPNQNEEKDMKTVGILMEFDPSLTRGSLRESIQAAEDQKVGGTGQICARITRRGFPYEWIPMNSDKSKSGPPFDTDKGAKDYAVKHFAKES